MAEKTPQPVDPPAETAAQIAALNVDPDKPLIIVDADEVLFQFMAGFVDFIEGRGLRFDWASFALSGNIREAESGRVLERPEVGEHLKAFFQARAAKLKPVEGAAKALKTLSDLAGIIVLSNVPADSIAARESALRNGGMDYPLIANDGLKGPAVRDLAKKTTGPVAFVDDIPHNHESVAKFADDVLRIQFIAHPKLRPLLKQAEHCHHRLNDWMDISSVVKVFFADHTA